MKPPKNPAPPRPAEGKQLAPPPPMEGKPLAVKKKKSRAGRKKERMQISVRIDQVLMEWAHDVIASRPPKEKIRITDLLERGLRLALKELKTTEPVISQARFVLNEAGVGFSRRMLNIYALERFPKVRPLSLTEQQFSDFYWASIDAISQWPNYQEALSADVMETIA